MTDPTKLTDDALLERVPHEAGCASQECRRCGTRADSGYHDMGRPAGAAHRFDRADCDCVRAELARRLRGLQEFRATVVKLAYNTPAVDSNTIHAIDRRKVWSTNG